jgi:hypothetical protein
LPHSAPQVLVLSHVTPHRSPHETSQFGPSVHVKAQSFPQSAMHWLSNRAQNGAHPSPQT